MLNLTKKIKPAVQPSSSVELITPMRAEEWMKLNVEHNRKLSEPAIAKYAKALREGRWQIDGQAIKFDWNGELIDGQNRLEACIRTGISFETFICRGLNPMAYKTQDSGKPRSSSDVLFSGGQKTHGVVIAAGIRWVIDIESGNYNHSTRIDNDVILAWWEEHPEIVDSVAPAYSTKAFLAPGIGVALHHLFSRKDPDLANKFFNDISEGKDLKADDPAYALREHLLKEKLNKARVPGTEIVARVIRSWNNVRAGRRQRLIKGLIKTKDGLIASFPTIE